jgi:glycosyltransferase involved in cell wall biosynthesis
VPSNYLKGVLVAWRVPSEKIEVIYNSVELSELVPLGDHPTGFLVVSSGRRVPWKGFEALERVVARQKSWQLHIASSVSREETLGWVKGADVFVLNSTYEGLSHALIEAMMLGTPIIATRVGGNSELIEDGVTGLLVAPGDDDALFAALKNVEQDAAAARGRAAAAQARIAKFSTQTMLSATSALLKKI